MPETSNSSRRRSSYYRYVLLLVVLASCSRSDRIVVGAKAFTEGYLLGHMAVLVLEDAGYNVEEQFGVASSAMRSALESGQVDLYYEYTGTAYTVYTGGSDPVVMSDSAQVLDAVRRYDRNRHNLEWLQPVPFNDTYALLMRRASSERDGITSLSSLADRVQGGKDFTIAVDAEFYERPDGLKAMVKHYGIPDRNIIKMDAGLIYTALNEGKIDIGMGYSTDGRIEAFDLVVLEDDRRFFPAYNPAAVVRSELLQRKPGVRDALLRLNLRLDASTIRRLNAEVDLHHRDPRKVARKWLQENGLLRAGNSEAGRRNPSPRSLTLLND
jgi:osmoprotectant transport system substrate-binding protein